MIRKAPNINHLWAYLIVEELVRCDVTHFFVAPGSRSTPLVTALARHPKTRSVIHFDERGTAFAALGYARAARKPAAWITTSGTAIANGLPAVVEAFVDAVPLLILTADRPPELRRTGANQTITQPGIFGNYVRWAFDGPAPDKNISPSFVLTTIDQAVHRSKTGPVHLNWMFREPLGPQSDGSSFDQYLLELSRWEQVESPFTSYASVKKTADEHTVAHVCEIVSSANRGLVVAGRMGSFEEGLAALQVAECLNWPLFADIGSQITGHFSNRLVISNFEYLVNKPLFSEGPDVILQFGKRYISKKLLSWISQSAFSHLITVDNYPDRLDPTHKVTFKIEADIEKFSKQFCERVEVDEAASAGLITNWTNQWQQQDEEVADQLMRYFQDKVELSEPLVARTITQLLSGRQTLIVANSMPVRDMDMFGLIKDERVQVILNRGVSGIDGTVATAAGAALNSTKPCTLLIGDLSLLHDLNSLALLKNLPFPLVIVVINNDGGGIFSFLPISSYNDVFESHFAVPHGLNFKASAEMFGLAYEKPDNIESFRIVYMSALQDVRSTIIEVQTDRERNLATHEAISQFLVAQ